MSPILEYIGENRNKDVEFQPITLHALGGAVLLDGLHIRNVVFQDVDVVYEGGPLIMEGVTFVNCTFNGVRQTPSGRRLLLAVSSQSDVIEFQEAA